jgi:Ca2+-transporting ATPase
MNVYPRSDWHGMSIDDALSALDSTAIGLSDREAAERLRRYGPNRLPPPPAVSALKILRDQLSGVVVLLLVAAAAISLVLSDYVEAAAIAAVLVINTSIGFLTEWRARRAMEALRQLDVPRASAVRDGHLHLIDADRLVPGDVIEISAGHAVPADARLIATTDLRIDEAALTGESLPVSKSSGVVLDAATDLAERHNMVFKGTTVGAGLGRALVTTAGPHTEVGRIGALTTAVEPEPTPLERRLDALGRRLVWLTLAVAALVVALGVAQSAPFVLVVETAIALAVAAVPEALPAVATIALAVGMRRMARRHALVRRLPAVETLGSTTVVCTDKTRTLTSGDMAVVRVCAAGREWDVLDVTNNGPDSDATSVLQGAALASRPQVARDDAGPLRDPMDAAILQAVERMTMGHADSVLSARRVGLIPFSSDRKWMAAFFQTDEAVLTFAKGAPRMLLDRSTTALAATGLVALDAAARRDLERVNDRMALQGLRVLGVASASVPHPDETAVQGLTFLGFIGLADPPAAGVAETVATLRAAGLRTIMLTGDQRLTATAVGRAIGLLGPTDTGMDGRAIEQLTGAALDEAIARTSAFRRVTPEH